jgi:Tfp pilus assembly protein PilN
VPFWTRPRRRIATALGAAVLVLGAVDVQQQLSLRRAQLQGLEQQIERMFRGVAPETTRIVNAPHQLRSKMDEMERRLALFPDASRDPTHPLAVLSAVTSAVPPGVRLDVHGYTQSTDVLHLEGEIDSLGAVSALRTALEGLPFVQRVSVGPARKNVADRVEFQLDLALTPAATGGAP